MTEKTAREKAAETQAIAAEAQDDSTVEFEVEIKGKKMKLQAPADIMEAPASVMVAYEARNIGTMLQKLLGEAQWNQLMSRGTTTRELFEVVFPAYSEAAGLGEG